MFDALEQEFKGTEQADLINMLYQGKRTYLTVLSYIKIFVYLNMFMSITGKMIDYVKCLECGTEKSREDTFLDIPLPVRPFGSNVAYGSVVNILLLF